MTQFLDLLRAEPIDMAALGNHLNGLDSDERIRQVRQIPGSLQTALFTAAANAPALTMDYFVPPEAPVRTFVRHFGKNSLPIFSNFEKRFARPSPESEVLWGFNHGPTMGLIGPGHFILRTGPGKSELHVDYYSIPDERLEGAPALQPNTKGISTLVYGNMIDVLRRVSDHVTVGRAIKHGKETPNYFLLCRQDPLPGN